MSKDRRFNDGRISKGLSDSPIKILEIANSYDFQVIFGNFAFKDKICHINFSYLKGYVPYICNQLCLQCSSERNDIICEGLVLF